MPHNSRFAFSTVLVLVLLMCSPAIARAQTFFSPFMGANVGGDLECPASQTCADPGVTLGAAYGNFANFVGLEEDFGYVSNPFRGQPPADSRMLTLMTNVMVGPKFGFVRPYGMVGVGFLRAKVDAAPGRPAVPEQNDFGWNLGAGIIAAYGHIGVRADLRFFHSFTDFQSMGFPVSGELNFGRASIGLVIQ